MYTEINIRTSHQGWRVTVFLSLCRNASAETHSETRLDRLFPQLPFLSFNKLRDWQRRYQYLSKVFREVVGQLEMNLLNLVWTKKYTSPRPTFFCKIHTHL